MISAATNEKASSAPAVLSFLDMRSQREAMRLISESLRVSSFSFVLAINCLSFILCFIIKRILDVSLLCLKLTCGLTSSARVILPADIGGKHNKIAKITEKNHVRFDSIYSFILFLLIISL